MIALTGQTRERALIAKLSAAGVGEITQPWEYPPKRTPWAFDNGAFTYWQRGQNNPHTPEWWRRVQRLKKEDRCLFAVIPDVPTDRAATLAWARSFGELYAKADLAVPCALAVQDGMTPQDLEGLPCVRAIFVGGSSEWKWRTAPIWARHGKESGRWVHIGRVSTPAKIRAALRLGVDSVDSSFPLWTRGRLSEWLEAVRGEAPQQREIWA